MRMILKATIALIAMLASAGYATAQQPYGPSGTLGPAGAPARTCGSSCVTVNTSGSWQSTIQGASGGSTVLMEAGSYNPTGTLTIPANVLVANLNGAAVTITGPIAMGGSNARLHGVTVDIGTEAGFGGIAIISTTSAVKSGVELAHIDASGATGETVRIRGNVVGYTVRDSIFDGESVTGHTMKVLCDDNSNVLGGSCTYLPSGTIRNSRFLRSGTSAGEDLLQFEGAGASTVVNNDFDSNANGEDCVDWKSQGDSNVSIVFSHNIVGPCNFEGLLMHQGDTTGGTTIEGNLFPDPSNLLRVTHANARVINNFFPSGSGLVISASNVDFAHNTVKGTFKRGDTTQGAPQNLEVINNIFSGTVFSCSSAGCGTVTSTRNVMHSTSGTFPCTNCITTNPNLSTTGNGYEITSTSSAADTAVSNFVVNEDIEGTSRPQGSFSDIGAFEVPSTNPPVEPTATLTASPMEIVSGSSSTLTWSSTDALGCDGTNFSTGGAASGNVSVSPTVTTTYTVDCDGALDSVTVVVNAAPPPPNDTTAPTVDIIAPTNGANLPRRDRVRIMIDATDVTATVGDVESGVDTVVLRIDGVIVATFNGEGGHDFNWRPGGRANRTATIHVTARDFAANISTDSISVNITN